ncbi:Colorectal mutant cancer protein [Plecturocebus cupreus]
MAVAATVMPVVKVHTAATWSFALVAQARVQRYDLASLQPPPPRFKHSPASASQVAGITGPANSVFLVEMEFHHVGQAGLKLLTLGDPPASACQSAGITGTSHHTQLLSSFEICFRPVVFKLCPGKLEEFLWASAVGLEGDQSGDENITQMLKRAHDCRKTAENAAKALLMKLDGSCGGAFAVAGCSVQPWESLSSNSHTSVVTDLGPQRNCGQDGIGHSKSPLSETETESLVSAPDGDQGEP